MFDIGWSELLIIGVVGLLVIGPKDLPQMFRALGRMTAKARSMAREFSQAMDDAAKSSGLDDAASTLRDVRSMTSKKSLGLDALERAADRFEKWEPKIPAATAARPTAAVPDPAAAAPVSPRPAPAFDPEPAEPGRRRIRAVRRSDLGSDGAEG